MRPDVQKGQVFFGLSRGLPAPQGPPPTGANAPTLRASPLRVKPVCLGLLPFA